MRVAGQLRAVARDLEVMYEIKKTVVSSLPHPLQVDSRGRARRWGEMVVMSGGMEAPLKLGHQVMHPWCKGKSTDKDLAVVSACDRTHSLAHSCPASSCGRAFSRGIACHPKLGER